MGYPGEAIYSSYDTYLKRWTPNQFRRAAQHRKPVKGGRWSVRKYYKGPHSIKTWRAWTETGTRGRSWGRWCESQAEAFAWASAVAAIFATKMEEYERTSALRNLRRTWKWEK